MPGYNVGEAFIQISPNFDGFANQLTSRMRVAGDQGARDFARSFVDQLRRSTNNANIGPNAGQLAQQGAASGAKFSESFKATVQAALRSLPDITIDADSTAAQREIADLKTRLEALGNADIGVDISSNDAVKEMDRIRADLRRLQAESTDIDVKIDTGRAIAQLEALKAEIRTVNGDKADVKVSTGGARREISALTVLIAALVPAAAVAGVAVGGALVGVVPAAGTAALAVLGVKDAYQSGALDGTSFAESVLQGNDALAELKSTAAAGVLPGLDQGLQGLLGQLSPVNNLVAQFSRQIGGIAGTTGPALASLLTQLEPLFTTVGNILQIGANKLATFAESGDGVKQFSDFILANLPNVLDTLGEVAAAFVKIVEAVAPIGQVVLTVIGGLADAISSLPLPVLTGFIGALIVMGIALKIGTAISGLVTALRGLGTAFGIVALESISLRVALLASLGIFAVIATAIGIFASATGDSASNSDAAKEAMDSYAESVKKSTDALDEANVANTKKQLSDKGALADLDALHSANLALGVSYDDLAKSVNGSDAEFKNTLATLQKAGQANGGKEFVRYSVLASTLTSLRTGLHNATDEQKRYNSSLAGQLTDLDSVSRATGITSDQVKQYAQFLGLTVTESGAVAGSQAQIVDAVRQVSAAFNTATQTGSTLLDAVNTFSGSAGTAADRATLIGATLKAANGDALNFAGQMNASAAAGSQFGKSIKSAADDVGKGGVSTKRFLDSIINLKTGTIDYKNAAAGPLIQGIQGIQTAAVNAAKATYQHALATKSGKDAASDAYKVYVSQTKSQLTDQLKSLGLTTAQAKRLAKQYLDTPKSVKTLVQQEGANPVLDVLKQIRNLLGVLTGHPYKTQIDTYGNALPNIAKIREQLNNLPKSVGVSVNAVGQIAVKGGGRYAKGGTIPPNTRFTVGEEGWEGGESDAQGRVTIYSHPKSVAMGYPAPVGFASGTGKKSNAPRINTTITQLFAGSKFTSGVIIAIRNGVKSGVTLAFRPVAAPTMKQFLTSATKTVKDSIAAAVAPANTTTRALQNALTSTQSTAVSKTQTASVALAKSGTADKNAAALQRNSDRVAKQLRQERTDAAADARKSSSKAADLRARATKLSRNGGDKGEIKRLRNQADAVDKAARKDAAASAARVKTLQKEADAAKSAADRGKDAAGKLKDAWKTAADAAKDAQQAAGEAAKALVESLQQQADDLAQTVADFKKTVADSLTSGTDLSSIVGQAGVTAAAEGATAARKDAEAAYQNAQANLRAIQARVATAGGTPADYAALTAAQQAQTEAVTKLTTAQQAETTAAAALADQQKSATSVTAAQLQAQFNQTLAQTQTFATDVQKLAAAGAGQDIITQVLGLGADAGDSLAKSLLQAGPSGIAALQSSMTQISTVAAKAGDALSGVFYAKGQNTLLQLVQGMQSQFPALKAALAPIVNTINAALTAERNAAVSGKVLTTSKGLPSFASGVANFRGPAALVHGGELLINNQTPGLDVLTAKQTQSLVSQVSAPVTARAAINPNTGTSRFEGDLYLDSGEFLGRVRGEANGVVDARVASARARADRRVRGDALDHLAAR